MASIGVVAVVVAAYIMVRYRAAQWAGGGVVAALVAAGVASRRRAARGAARGDKPRGYDIAFALLALVAAAPLSAAEITGRVVDPQGQPVREAVVFVDQLPPGSAPPTGERTAVIDQVHREYVPHVLPVEVGTVVSFPNHDQIHHHVYSLSRTKTFEIPLYKGETAPPVRFDQVGAVKLGCNIHDWMAGVILVVPTPYFATTDEQGAFALRDLPPGTYGVVAWHEGSKAKLDDTRQTIAAGDGAPPLTFTLEVSERRARPAARRGYE